MNSTVLILLASLTASLALTLAFWNKPKLFRLLPLSLLIFAVLTIAYPITTHDYNPCSRTPIYAQITFASAFFVVALLVSSLSLALLGAFQWILFRKDVQKSQMAKARAFSGLITLLFTVVLFIVINITINAMGLGGLSSLCIPTLQEFK